MWKEYGDEGVAITSQYRLLKSALNAMSDRAYIGPVRFTHAINRDKLVAQNQVMEAMMKPGLVN